MSKTATVQTKKHQNPLLLRAILAFLHSRYRRKSLIGFSCIVVIAMLSPESVVTMGPNIRIWSLHAKDVAPREKSELSLREVTMGEDDEHGRTFSSLDSRSFKYLGQRS